MIEIFMPKAGMDMQEGTLIRWLKNIGDEVEKDEPIMEIETDKITMEAEAPGSGIFLSKLVDDGAVVPVLTVIGYIGEKGNSRRKPRQWRQPTRRQRKWSRLQFLQKPRLKWKKVSKTARKFWRRLMLKNLLLKQELI